MDDDSHAAEIDSYGPGADLMISLFAVAILLLSIVGAGQQFESIGTGIAARSPPQEPEPVKDRRSPPPLRLVSRADFERLRAEYEARLAEEAALKAEIERQAAEIAGSADKLAALQAALKQQDEANRSAIDTARTEADALRTDSRMSRDQQAELEAELKRLRAEYAAQRSHNADLTAETKRLGAELAEARARRDREEGPGESVGDYVELAEIERSVGKLASAFARSATPPASLEADERRRIAAKAATFPANANELLIETYIPSELLAFAPKDFKDEDAMDEVYRFSALLAEAYRGLLARNGIPLGCLRISPRTFERAPDIRRQIMGEATDGPEAFRQIAEYERLVGPTQEAGQAVATIRILQGLARSTLCDPDLLKAQLARLAS
ncbi:hypothetical protein [Fulvimarina sp. MAC3]|uniref:hypothetical protein n=1 Tax=Fulvimarina sp. MAC3 TaxID=3148887 RepID=UPI0031FD9FF7